MNASSQPPGYDSWIEGNRLFRSGHYHEAVLAFSDAIRQAPDQSRYYHNRAVARAALQDAQGAREDLWRTLELESDPKGGRDLARALRGVRVSAETEGSFIGSKTQDFDRPSLRSDTTGESDWNSRLDRLRLLRDPHIDALSESLLTE